MPALDVAASTWGGVSLKRRQPRGRALGSTAIAWCLLTGSPAVAQTPAIPTTAPRAVAESAAWTEPGNHFILLFDDSKTMDDVSPEAYAPAVVHALFDARGTTDAPPTFVPDRDRLSIAFFAIHGLERGCSGRKIPNDITTLEGLFDWVSPGDFARTRGGVDQYLREELPKPCRLNGNWGPINTAPVVILPFVHRRIRQTRDPLFTRTFIVLVSDGKYNSSTAAGELRTAQARGVRGVRDVAELAARISALFALPSPPGWTIERGGFYVQTLEVRPHAKPDANLTFSTVVHVDRRAVASDRLVLAPDNGVVTLRNTHPGANTPGFKPVALSLTVEAKEGGVWTVGPTTGHSTATVQLASCTPPVCTKQPDGTIAVSILHAILGDISLPASAPQPTDAVVTVRAVFRLDTGGIYDPMIVSAPDAALPPHTIDLKMVPPVEIAGTVLAPQKVRLDNAELAAWYRPGDTALTQEMARERVLASRRQGERARLIAAAVAFLALASAFLWWAVRRRFDPQLEWEGAGEVVLDFTLPVRERDGHPAAPVLVGTVRVRNRAPLPLFGRLFAFYREPKYPVTVEVAPPDLVALGLRIDGDGPPVGLLASREGAKLELRRTGGDFADGREFFLFLAASRILDVQRGSFEMVDGGPAWTREVSAALAFAWRPGFFGNRPAKIMKRDVKFAVRAIPEAAQPPVVRFAGNGHGVSDAGTVPAIEFKKGQDLSVGAFMFTSRATRDFAVPHRDDYLVQFHRGPDSLSGSVGRLVTNRIDVPPRAGADPHVSPVAVPVHVACDGVHVRNPDASAEDYALTLLGRCAEESEKGPHPFRILRDTTRADVVLRVVHEGFAYEAFWQNGTPTLRRFGAGRSALIRANGHHVSLAPVEVCFERGAPVTHRLLAFEIGNSGSVGRGTVAVDFRTKLVMDDLTYVKLTRGYALDGLVSIDHGGQSVGGHERLIVAEGEVTSRAVVLDPAGINSIPNGRVGPQGSRVDVTLDFEVTTDQGERSHKTVAFEIPIELEELPGSSWLCIDLGTSAIAATVGTAGSGVVPVPLQDVPLEGPDGTYRLSTYDKDNAEAGTNLLPSAVAFDGDRRSRGATGKPGTPLAPGSDMIADPCFLSLPAVRHHRAVPGRVVASVKSWLSRQSSDLFLPDPIASKDKTLTTRERSNLPLDEVLEALFGALVDGYLRPQHTARQIVITHPNAFTDFHRARLHQAAFRAVRQRLDIPLENRIHLMSESDAVAYYYCHQQRIGHFAHPRTDVETMLVYDFGSGTLDLSLIDVEWTLDPLLPRRWNVRGRLGVPVAGDFIDESLTRLVDGCLRKLAEEGDITYQFPLVGLKLVRDHERDHLIALENARGAMRHAKHRWNGNARFDAVVGFAQRGIESLVTAGNLPAEPPPADAPPGLWRDPGPEQEIRLSLPPTMVTSALSDFTKFVTEDVTQELLANTAYAPEDVDTVVVSGRGALFPGIRDRVWNMFPHAERPRLSVQEMKEAVAMGAIARHQLGTDLERDGEPKMGRLGVLHDKDRKLILEDQWGTPQLLLDEHFRFVQVNCVKPAPTVDMKTMRRHFYVPLSDGVIARSTVRKNNEKVTISLEPGPGGTFGVAVTNVTTGKVAHPKLKHGEALPTGMQQLLLRPL